MTSCHLPFGPSAKKLLMFKIVPYDFVEPVTVRFLPPQYLCFISLPHCYPCSAVYLYGWAGRIRTCACQDQNLVPYRLATAQF